MLYCTYLAHSLGHEGENSLLSELIRQDLGVSVMAGNAGRLQETFGGFYIDITLTDKGMKDWEPGYKKEINMFKCQPDYFQLNEKYKGL